MAAIYAIATCCVRYRASTLTMGAVAAALTAGTVILNLKLDAKYVLNVFAQVDFTILIRVERVDEVSQGRVIWFSLQLYIEENLHFALV